MGFHEKRTIILLQIMGFTDITGHSIQNIITLGMGHFGSHSVFNVIYNTLILVLGSIMGLFYHNGFCKYNWAKSLETGSLGTMSIRFLFRGTRSQVVCSGGSCLQTWVSGCDTIGPKHIWSPDIWSPTIGPQLIGPSGQTVPNQFSPHGQMVPKNVSQLLFVRFFENAESAVGMKLHVLVIVGTLFRIKIPFFRLMVGVAWFFWIPQPINNPFIAIIPMSFYLPTLVHNPIAYTYHAS